MSDFDSPPRSPFAPLRLSCGESVGFSGSQNPGSRPRDHRSQVSCRPQGSPLRNGAQHTCGLPQLSLHGFGLPRTTSEVFYTSHRDSVKTIQAARHNLPTPNTKHLTTPATNFIATTQPSVRLHPTETSSLVAALHAGGPCHCSGRCE